MYGRRTPDEALQVRHRTMTIRVLRHTEYQSIPIVIENEKGTERQVKGKGHFDEHKIMLGFSSTGEAEGCYNAHYPPSISRLQTITDMSMAQFIRKLKTHRWNNAV